MFHHLTTHEVKKYLLLETSNMLHHCCGSTLTSLAASCPAAPQCLSGEQSTGHGLVCQGKQRLRGRVGCSRGLVRPNWCWIVDAWEREKPIKATIKNNRAKFQRVLVISADVTAASSGDVQSLVVQAGKAENSELLGCRDGKLPKHKLCSLNFQFFFLLVATEIFWNLSF